MGKVKTVDFSGTIAASDLNVGRCRQLIETSWLLEEAKVGGPRST